MQGRCALQGGACFGKCRDMQTARVMRMRGTSGGR